MAVAASPWAAMRFRRSKHSNGWTLLGISQPCYGEVVQLLFEQQARLLKKFEQGEFVNLLFESPELLAVRLALAFPAPPGCEPIVVDAAGDRLLTEPFPKSLAQVRWQLKAGQGEARLEQLSGRETFAQVIATWARANGPGANDSLQLSLPPTQKAGRVAAATGLDAEGFEEDEWEEDVVDPTKEETFEDVWEVEELQSVDPSSVERLAVDQQSAEQAYLQPSRSQQLSSLQQPNFWDEAGAIAEPTQQPLPPHRVELPFEQPNASTANDALDANELGQNSTSHGRSEGGQRPVLPAESWAAAAVLEGDYAVVDEAQYHAGAAWNMSAPSEQFATKEGGDSCYEAQRLNTHQERWRTSRTEQSAISTLARLADGLSSDCSPVLMPSQALSTPPKAPDDHGYVLSQGVAIWNEWRRVNPHIRPTLRGAYLNNLDLAGADFHGVDLGFALLFRADLREADLSSALLLGADLIRADLGGALLWGASLEGAYLSYANLAGADLTQAYVQGAYWQGAILEGAILPNGQRFETR